MKKIVSFLLACFFVFTFSIISLSAQDKPASQAPSANQTSAADQDVKEVKSELKRGKKDFKPGKHDFKEGNRDFKGSKLPCK